VVNLANLLRLQGQFDAARALLEPHLTRYGESSELLLTLGSTWREAGDAQKAEEYYRAALDHRPDYAPALSNLADLLADQGSFEAAQSLYDRALKASGGHAQVRLNRAILHFLMGNLEEAWRDYEARRDIPNKVPAAHLKLPEWQGAPLKGGRLLVRAEQGIGDQVMFISLVPDLVSRLGNGQVILECETRLVPLAARSFPDMLVKPQILVTNNGTVTADYGWLNRQGGANAFILMGSLPRWLRKNLDAFPKDGTGFLKPESGEQAHWKSVFAGLGSSPLIGICWRSGKSGGHRSAQFAPLEAWGSFLHGQPGTIISCQYDANADEIAALEGLSGRRIFVPPALDQKSELDRTAAMLSQLDQVLSAPTAVSWLAAGTGVSTLKLLYDTSWTAFGRNYEPLAPACRCIGPAQPGDWRDVFSRAAALIKRP
jgi:hypothetical protein